MTEACRVRLETVYGTTSGVLRDNPVKRAAAMWGPDGDGAMLNDWLKHPGTRIIEDLLIELSMNPPSGLVGTDKIENYGLTSGLQLAAQVVRDPTMLFAHVFSDQDHPAAGLETEYTNEA